MIKRTVEVSSPDIELNIRDSQVVVSRAGTILDRIPAEDIGILIVDTPRAYYSHSTVLELMNAGATVVVCGANHLPVTVMHPIEGNTVQTERMRSQIECSAPLRKQLWKQIVRAKIAMQRENLIWLAGRANEEATVQSIIAAEDLSATANRMSFLISKVKSGDPTNTEGQASRLYWTSFYGSDFRRDRDGDAPNNLLNYGYAIMRASVARAIVGAGLHPSVGLFHKNRYNAFCLADDLMEPLRPIVDRIVRQMAESGEYEVSKSTKKALLEMLTLQVETYNLKGPLMVALEKMTASLCRCYAGESKEMEIPHPCW